MNIVISSDDENIKKLIKHQHYFTKESKSWLTTMQQLGSVGSFGKKSKL